MDNIDPTDRKNELTGKSHLVRLYEANAGIQFPTDADLRFRSALAMRLAKDLNLEMVRETPRRMDPAANRR